MNRRCRKTPEHRETSRQLVGTHERERFTFKRFLARSVAAGGGVAMLGFAQAVAAELPAVPATTTVTSSVTTVTGTPKARL